MSKKKSHLALYTARRQKNTKYFRLRRPTTPKSISFSPIKHRPSTPRYRTPVKKDLLLLYLKDQKKVRTDNTKAEWESEWEDCKITLLDIDTEQNELFFKKK